MRDRRTRTISVLSGWFLAGAEAVKDRTRAVYMQRFDFAFSKDMV